MGIEVVRGNELSEFPLAPSASFLLCQKVLNDWNVLHLCFSCSLSFSTSPVLYFYRTQVFCVFDLMAIDLIYPSRAMN